MDRRSTEQLWPMYPKRSFAYWWQRAGTLLGVCAVIATAVEAYVAPPCEPARHLYAISAAWAVLPPIWWWLEMFFIYPAHHTERKFELLKQAAHASLAIWAPIAVGLAAYASSDYFKPPESGSCRYAKAS